MDVVFDRSDLVFLAEQIADRLVYHTGIDRRTMLAGMALQGLLARTAGLSWEETPSFDQLAVDARDAAEALLAALDAPPVKP